MAKTESVNVEPIPKLHQPFAHMPLFSPTCVAARFIKEDPWSDVEPKRKAHGATTRIAWSHFQ